MSKGHGVVPKDELEDIVRIANLGLEAMEKLKDHVPGIEYLRKRNISGTGAIYVDKHPQLIEDHWTGFRFRVKS